MIKLEYNAIIIFMIAIAFWINMIYSEIRLIKIVVAIALLVSLVYCLTHNMTLSSERFV